MLSLLFANRNIERVLLFLFLNGTCYASQIQTLLAVPLTPLQLALQRLEKGGVIKSYYEGKTKLYEFNPHYSYRSELEALLKKAYTLLPVQEKKKYCFIHKPRLSLEKERKRERSMRHALDSFWERIHRVKTLNLTTKSRQERTTKQGKAEVLLSSPSSNTLIFQERGHWLAEEMPFTNSFQWTLDLKAGLITLEHLRHRTPVFLLNLTPTRTHMLESVDAHLCGDDTYLGNLVWDDEAIEFRWRVIGPHKDGEMLYLYR